MNKYLLLRDNKQTGPYTVEELVKKGIKPYDLVWLEGRSAAWRYPSEIDELKAFAPVVEEQPYDRFYKRSSSAQQHAIHAAQQQLGKQEQSLPAVEHTSTPAFTAQTNSAVQGNTEQTIAAAVNSPKETSENIPVSKPVVKTGTGKVYVTLPAGFRQKQAVQQTGSEEIVKTQPVQAKKETTVPVTQAFSGNMESDKQEEARVSQEAAKALEARAAALAESIQAAAAAASKKQTAQQAIQQWNQQSSTSKTQQAKTPVEQPANFSSLINKQQEETVPVIPMRNQSGRKHLLLMRSIVAACLLLGGIVIGMALTYSKSGSENQKALDQLVQRLQEREAQRQAGIQPEQKAGETTAPNNAEYAEESTPPDGEQSHIQDNNSGRQLTEKDKQLPPVVNNNDAAVTFQEKDPQEMKVTQAVITRKDEPRPVREADVAAAREKIYQMVQVAASPFRTGVLGGISNLYFTVSNTSSFPLDQIELEIKYLGPENRVVKVQRLLFNDVGAGAQKTLEAPRTSRGVSIDYVITKINSRALGIARTGF